MREGGRRTAVPPPMLQMPQCVHSGDAQNQSDQKKPV